MIEKAHGLILRIRPFTETSLIVHWLTREFGRIHTVAKGARRARSPFRGKLDLFYIADFTFSRSRRSELHTLAEVSLCEIHPAIRGELARLQQASYCAALIEQATEIETPLPAIFELMRDFLSQSSQTPPQSRNIFAFEFKLLNELGLKPDLSKSQLNVGTKKIVKALLENDWENISRLKLSGAQDTELRQFLHGFLIYHLERIPKGRNTALPMNRATGSTLHHL